jgi:hypothetical protein
MPTASGLPVTLREYLEVWCADLLDPLTAAQRASVISIVHHSYAGGPWPPRLQIQRMAEIAAGVITGDACVGELVARYGYPIDDVIEMLRCDDPDVRDNAIVTLGRYPDTTQLIPKVSAARGAGALTDTEFSENGYAASVDAVRHALGHSDFDSTWTEGAALSTLEAIAYAAGATVTASVRPQGGAR